MCWLIRFTLGCYYLSFAKFFQPGKYRLAWQVMNALKFEDEPCHESDDEWHSSDERAKTPIDSE